MDRIDLQSWGPLTVLAVIVVTLFAVGGVVEVCTTPYTFGQLLNDLRPVAAALAGGVAVGRGIRLAPHAVTTKTPRRARTARDAGYTLVEMLFAAILLLVFLAVLIWLVERLA